MPEQCPQGHSLHEAFRTQIQETMEDVVYVTLKIKKFNREGAENMETVKIPKFVERTVEVDLVEYVCNQCGWKETVRKSRTAQTDV